MNWPGVDLDALGECLLKIAKDLTIMYMEFEKAMEQVANIARAGVIGEDAGGGARFDRGGKRAGGI